MGATTTRKTTVLTAAVAALTTAGGLAAAPPAGAAGSSGPGSRDAELARGRVLSSTVAAPFQVAVHGHRVYYTDGVAGTVNLVRRGPDRVLARAPGEIAGVELAPRRHTMAFTSSTASGTALTIRRAGRADVVADLSGYEQRVNPDGGQHYGVAGAVSPCAATWLKTATGQDAAYTGEVDSHPYQVAYLGRGAWAVADAAGNDVLRVDRRGRVSTLAVLPPQPVRITRSMAAALHAPDCVVGLTYAFEPVPTDVERGPGGGLWVTTLPGGPEDASLGARGSVYRLSSRGAARRVATGFAGATNLAVTRRGTIFVVEHFADKVTRLRDGRRSTVLRLPRVVSVETRPGRMYVGQLGDLSFSDPKAPPTVTSPGSVRVYRR